MKYLLFQLYAHSQSWGTSMNSRFMTTEDHPTKSAILGLVGTAMGIKMEDMDLHPEFQSLFFACREEAVGTIRNDFQTTIVEGYKEKGKRLIKFKENSILANKEYLQDAAFIGCLWGIDDFLLSIQKALRTPHFTVSLGRMSCPPALPFKPEIIEAINLKKAFSSYTIDSMLEPILAKGPLRFFWETEDNSIPIVKKIIRRDQPLLWKCRSFATREENIGFMEKEDKPCIISD